MSTCVGGCVCVCVCVCVCARACDIKKQQRASASTAPDALLGQVIPTGSHLAPEGVVLILDLLVVLDALVDVMLASQGCDLLLQLCLPGLHCLQLPPLLLGYCLCLPHLLLHCLPAQQHADVSKQMFSSMPTQLHKVPAAKRAVLWLLVCHSLAVWTVCMELFKCSIPTLCVMLHLINEGERLLCVADRTVR